MQRKHTSLLSNTRRTSSTICASHKDTYQYLSIIRTLLFSMVIYTLANLFNFITKHVYFLLAHKWRPSLTNQRHPPSEHQRPPNPPWTPQFSLQQLHLFACVCTYTENFFCVCVYVCKSTEICKWKKKKQKLTVKFSQENWWW